MFGKSAISFALNFLFSAFLILHDAPEAIMLLKPHSKEKIQLCTPLEAYNKPIAETIKRRVENLKKSRFS
jgi:hypothetical protein